MDTLLAASSSSTLNTRPVIFLTSLGLCLSTSFSIGSLGLTYFALPAVLLPADAPLMPPLNYVFEQRANHFRKGANKPPMQPGDSGVGDKEENVVDNGAVSQRVGARLESSESYLLRQWFHIFAKGMVTFPPMAVGGALSYALAGLLVPGRLLDTGDSQTLAKRGLFILAAVLSGGIMVFTLTVMKPTNEALQKRVKQVVENEKAGTQRADDGKRKAEAEVLIRNWGKVNSTRAVLPLLAGITALFALMV